MGKEFNLPAAIKKPRESSALLAEALTGRKGGGGGKGHTLCRFLFAPKICLHFALSEASGKRKIFTINLSFRRANIFRGATASSSSLLPCFPLAPTPGLLAAEPQLKVFTLARFTEILHLFRH